MYPSCLNTVIPDFALPRPSSAGGLESLGIPAHRDLSPSERQISSAWLAKATRRSMQRFTAGLSGSSTFQRALPGDVPYGMDKAAKTPCCGVPSRAQAYELLSTQW